MKRINKYLMIATMFLATAGSASAQVTLGIRIGPPPQARAYRVPPQPGPGYEWVEGYWYPQGPKYVWHDGYWTRPPYEGAYWSAPYYAGGRYYAGRWEGSRGVLRHSHQWDRTPQRDERREPVKAKHRGKGHDKHDDHRDDHR